MRIVGQVARLTGDDGICDQFAHPINLALEGESVQQRQQCRVSDNRRCLKDIHHGGRVAKRPLNEWQRQHSVFPSEAADCFRPHMFA